MTWGATLPAYASRRGARDPQFLRPANLPPAGTTRPLPTHPKVRSFGALDPHTIGRATLSPILAPAQSRATVGSRGLCSRGSISPAEVGGRSVSLRPQPRKHQAQCFAQSLKASVVCGPRHGPERRRLNVEALRQSVEGLRNGHE